MLNLYTPSLNDLYFCQMLLSDYDTMQYNHAYGGTISFPKEKQQSWYKKWIETSSQEYFYRYLQNTDTKEFVGEVAYHFDNNRNIFICDIIILAKFRENGYGTIGLNLLCNAAKENGIKEIFDDIAADNPAIKLFLKSGFNIEYKTKDIIMVKKVL